VAERSQIDVGQWEAGALQEAGGRSTSRVHGGWREADPLRARWGRRGVGGAGVVDGARRAGGESRVATQGRGRGRHMSPWDGEERHGG
jgi:hypothetical protein